MAIDYEDRQKHNTLLKSHGYRWVKADSHWILKDPQGQITTLEKALAVINHHQDAPATTNTISPVERPAVQRWAQTILKHRPFMLSTITHGHGTDAEIIDIALVDVHGHTVFDSLVRPTQATTLIDSSAHDITEKMLEKAPTFAELWRPLRPFLTGYEIIMYNASSDIRVLRQTAAHHQLVIPAVISHSLMKHYALYTGEKISEREYKAQTLSEACAALHINLAAQQRALPMAQATQEILLALASPSISS